MPNDPAVTVESFAHHSVNASQSRRAVDKEEVYGYFVTAWRGQQVRVTMKASRYVPSSGEWTEWRVFADDARYIDESGRGEATTPKARTTLADRCRNTMEAWIAGATVREAYAEGAQRITYAESRRNAFARFIRDELRECRPWEDATRNVRALLEKYAAELEPDALAALVDACDAYDAFSEAYRRVLE